MDTKSQFLASLESHSKLKILSYNVICLQGTIWKLEYGSHVDDPSSCWLNRLLEVVLSNFYTPQIMLV